MNRFDHAKCYKTLYPANGRWLKTLPELQIVADEEYNDVLRRLAAANQHQVARRRLRIRNQLKWQLQQPHAVAAMMLARMANVEPIQVKYATDWRHPDGTIQKGHGVITRTGMGVMFLGATHAELCETYTQDGRRLTIELDNAELNPIMNIPRMSKSAIDEENQKIAGRTNRILCSVHRSMIEEAVAAVSTFPVIEAAEYAVQKLTNDATSQLRVVHAAEKNSAGGWVWAFQVETVGIIGTMSFLNDEIHVQCADFPQLVFNQADVEAYGPH